MRDFENVKRVVFKIGSSSLVDENLNINSLVIDELMKVAKELIDKNIKPIVVTSGAIALGRIELGLTTKPKRMPLKQACAAIGQIKLMQGYTDASRKYNLITGQILVNHDDFSVRKRMLNLTASLEEMLKNNIIPIINENDALAVEEIKVGDNDTLSSLIAEAVQADLLIIFSDIDGLYNKNPKLYNDAVLLSTVSSIDENILSMAGDATSSLGTGGMLTKLNAANIATASGADMIICSSKEIKNISSILNGKEIGTLFLKNETKRNKKANWLWFNTKPCGAIIIDKGLEDKLLENKASILPKGILRVTDDFLSGSVISVVTTNGDVIGKGISNYSSHDLEKIIGLSTNDVKLKLGLDSKLEVIHADNLVLNGGI